MLARRGASNDLAECLRRSLRTLVTGTAQGAQQASEAMMAFPDSVFTTVTGLRGVASGIPAKSHEQVGRSCDGYHCSSSTKCQVSL